MLSWLRRTFLGWSANGDPAPDAASPREVESGSAVSGLGQQQSTVERQAIVMAHAAEGERLFQLERYEPALAAFTQSLQASQSFSLVVGEGYELYRAGVLNNIGMCLSKLRQFDSARRVLEEAAQICERRWAVEGEHIAAMYAGILDSLAAVQGELGYLDDAMKATRRLVPLARQLALSGSPAATAALARALRKFALMRAPSGSELDEALAAATEAATLFGQLALVCPEAFDREVQVAHTVVVGVLEQLGRHQEAASIRQARIIVGVPWQARKPP